MLTGTTYQLQCWLKIDIGRTCKIEFRHRKNGNNGFIVRLRWPSPNPQYQHLVLGWHEDLEPALEAAFKCYDVGTFILEPVKKRQA